MTDTPTLRILPAEATGRPPQVQAMLECWHRMKCWMGQLNAGRKMPAEKYGYIHRKMEIEADQLRLHLLHPEISTASPNAGRVTAEMLEAAARAICELDIRQARQFDTAPARLEEMLTAAVNHAWDAYIDDARAAIEAIGLTVEG